MNWNSHQSDHSKIGYFRYLLNFNPMVSQLLNINQKHGNWQQILNVLY